MSVSRRFPVTCHRSINFDRRRSNFSTIDAYFKFFTSNFVISYKSDVIVSVMDVELLRPGNVPISPNTVLWFEFLFQPDLLEQHLKKINPGKNFFALDFHQVVTFIVY